MAGGEFLHLPVELIDVPADRARFLNPLKAEAIGATMKAERQFDPITVSPTDGGRFVLVDGQHRLHGAKHVGLPSIEARVIALSPEAQRKQEILSNLATAELDALGRARSIGALCEVWQNEDGRKRKIGRPNKKDIAEQHVKISAHVCTNFGWSAAAAAEVGLERRALFNYLRVARRVLPEAAAELANTPVANNLRALLQISDMDDAEQVDVARAVKERGFERLGDAVEYLRGKPAPAKPSKDELDYQRLETLFRRLPARLKRRFLNDVICHDKDVPGHIRACIGRGDA